MSERSVIAPIDAKEAAIADKEYRKMKKSIKTLGDLAAARDARKHIPEALERIPKGDLSRWDLERAEFFFALGHLKAHNNKTVQTEDLERVHALLVQHGDHSAISEFLEAMPDRLLDTGPLHRKIIQDYADAHHRKITGDRSIPYVPEETPPLEPLSTAMKFSLKYRDRPGFDFEALQEAVLTRGNSADAYFLAGEFDQADVSALQKRVVDLRNPEYIAKFANDVKGVDISELLKNANAEQVIVIATQVPKANLNECQERILEIGRPNWVRSFAYEVSETHPDFNLNRSLNFVLKNGTAQDAMDYARTVQGASIGKISERILEAGTSEQIYHFTMTHKDNPSALGPAEVRSLYEKAKERDAESFWQLNPMQMNSLKNLADEMTQKSLNESKPLNEKDFLVRDQDAHDQNKEAQILRSLTLTGVLDASRSDLSKVDLSNIPDHLKAMLDFSESNLSEKEAKILQNIRGENEDLKKPESSSGMKM